MQTKRDYYEVLGVDRKATAEEIKRAYRQCAMKYHPDRNPDDPEAAEHFKECAEAFEILGDAQKRQRYDQFGHEGLRGTGAHDFSGMDARDIFSMFEDLFGDIGLGGGGRRRGGRGARQRGYDLETEVKLTLEQVATGTSHQVEFTRQDTCPTCSGSGAQPGTQAQVCTSCGGRGQVGMRQGFFQMLRTCPACGGEGQVVAEKCPDCKQGRRPRKCRIEVKVPPGIHDAQVIRVGGEGEPGPHGGPRGDLHVVVQVARHKLFERNGDNLVMRVPLSFTQAALGATVEVPGLSGQSELVIKSGTQHGQVYTLKGEGLPNLRTGQKGDLVIQVLVEIPKKLTEEQEQLLRDFAQTEDHEVMPHSSGFWDKIKTYISGD
ncbi:MAG: molecular chaperone DnaJ [Phycisphaerae bacterium]|nr:molecular chaperone DnaJ [Phycisphaerae bacterium]